MERYQQIYYNKEDQRIFPGEGYCFEFPFETEENSEYRLFFTGEVEQFYWWKSEYCSTAIYKRIADSLVRGRKDAYALRMEGKDYPQLAFRKLVWTPVLGYLGLRGHNEHWRFGITASAKNVKEKGWLFASYL